jgi:multicomponent Na+:H+ antiporter subunit C
VSLLLAFCTALIFSMGTWLVLQRRLSRLIIGLGLLGHGANLLLLLSGGHRGVAPFIGSTEGQEVADPMPQALALTAIVISFGLTAFLLALAYRSWQLTGDDLVEDDLEDRRIANRLGFEDEDLADQLVLDEAELDDRTDDPNGVGAPAADEGAEVESPEGAS